MGNVMRDRRDDWVGSEGLRRARDREKKKGREEREEQGRKERQL